MWSAKEKEGRRKIVGERLLNPLAEGELVSPTQQALLMETLGLQREMFSGKGDSLCSEDLLDRSRACVSERRLEAGPLTNSAKIGKAFTHS